MQPSEWNIVVVGAWNRAILTPAWIGQTVFQLGQGTPADVLVPLDGLGMAPFQVRHEGVIVVPLPQQLLLQVEEPNETLLARAMGAARRAISDLPRTPLRACGINIRFSSPEPPTRLLEHTRCPTERLFSESGYELRTRRRGESLTYGEGILNVIADIPTIGQCTLVLNFDLQSTSLDGILGWLQRPASEYIDKANNILNLIVN